MSFRSFWHPVCDPTRALLRWARPGDTHHWSCIALKMGDCDLLYGPGIRFWNIRDPTSPKTRERLKFVVKSDQIHDGISSWEFGENPISSFRDKRAQFREKCPSWEFSKIRLGFISVICVPKVQAGNFLVGSCLNPTSISLGQLLPAPPKLVGSDVGCSTHWMR